MSEFIPGQEPDSRTITLAATSLQQLHEQGYLRRDPSLRNFIIADDKVYHIDTVVQRPLFLRRLRTWCEYAQFMHSADECGITAPPPSGAGFVFRIIRRYSHWRTRWQRRLRHWRKVLKGKRRLGSPR